MKKLKICLLSAFLVSSTVSNELKASTGAIATEIAGNNSSPVIINAGSEEVAPSENAKQTRVEKKAARKEARQQRRDGGGGIYISVGAIIIILLLIIIIF